MVSLLLLDTSVISKGELDADLTFGSNVDIFVVMVFWIVVTRLVSTTYGCDRTRCVVERRLQHPPIDRVVKYSKE